MPQMIYARESPDTIKEVAKYLRWAAIRLDQLADGLVDEEIEEVEVPLKKMAFDAIRDIEKWTAAAQSAWLKAKRESGALGPDTTGKGPKAGKPSPGSGNFRRKKK